MRTSTLFAAIVCLSCVPLAGRTVLGQTQAQMNESAGAEKSEAQREMEKQYARVLEAVADSPASATRVRKAQEAWEQYRRAQMAALYGCANAQATYGSAMSTCAAGADERLVTERADELRGMATPMEGDVCRWVATCE